MDGSLAAATRPSEEPQLENTYRLAQWFKDWREPVRHWLSRRASVPAAELDDLAQEVYMRLLRYPDALTRAHTPLSYLMTMASNVASEWRDLHRVNRPHEPEWLDDLLIDDTDHPDVQVNRQLCNAAVQAEIDSLPPNQRAAILLHINEELTYEQIAARLGRTHRAVTRDLARAYARLRERLSFDDIG